jgi:hypothetical protein
MMDKPLRLPQDDYADRAQRLDCSVCKPRMLLFYNAGIQ